MTQSTGASDTRESLNRDRTSEWMNACFVLLSKCDAMVYDRRSPGVDAEIGFATLNNIPVFRGVDALRDGLKK
jgi:hypothetical protein